MIVLCSAPNGQKLAKNALSFEKTTVINDLFTSFGQT